MSLKKKASLKTKHNAINDDCRAALPRLKAKRFDLAFADPPYNMSLNDIARPDGSEMGKRSKMRMA